MLENPLDMEPNESEANSDWRNKQKEQARERRRIWDRKRRLSMSLEERERHLARRRRYYQLRRQKEENAGLDLQRGKESSRIKFETRVVNDNLAMFPVSEPGVQSDGAIENDSGNKFLDDVSHKLPKSSGRLRLNQIRHLARSLNTSVGKPVAGCHQYSRAEVFHKGKLKHDPLKEKACTTNSCETSCTSSKFSYTKGIDQDILSNTTSTGEMSLVVEGRHFCRVD